MSQYDDHNTRHPHMSRCLTLIIRYCLVFCEKIQGMSSKITKFTFSDLICYEYNAIYMRIMMYSNLFRLTIVTNKCVLLIKLGITPPNIYHTSIATHNIYIYIYIYMWRDDKVISLMSIEVLLNTLFGPISFARCWWIKRKLNMCFILTLLLCQCRHIVNYVLLVQETVPAILHKWKDTLWDQ
jgi:hypothetical protein